MAIGDRVLLVGRVHLVLGELLVLWVLRIANWLHWRLNRRLLIPLLFALILLLLLLGFLDHLLLFFLQFLLQLDLLLALAPVVPLFLGEAVVDLEQFATAPGAGEVQVSHCFHCRFLVVEVHKSVADEGLVAYGVRSPHELRVFNVAILAEGSCEQFFVLHVIGDAFDEQVEVDPGFEGCLFFFFLDGGLSCSGRREVRGWGLECWLGCYSGLI